MRCARVGMPRVIGRRCSRISTRIETGKGIYPSARTESTLAIIQAGRVRIGASRTEMRAADAVTAIATVVVSQRGEGMLEPGLTNLFKALGVIGAATHSIQILWNDRVIVVRQLKPIEIDGSSIARSRSHPETDIVSSNSTVW